MSQDRTTQEYHLTPNGWVSGTFSVYGKVQKEVPPPADRVETWFENVDDSSGWAPQAIDWELIWVAPDVTPEIRAQLNKRFPKPMLQARKIFKKKKKKLADSY
jgi:hypothetical protein